MSDHDAEKEKKRKKALRRMGKIVARAWQLPSAEPFHSAASSSRQAILCLTEVGSKVDEEGYKYGRHGWKEFARDIGGVYNRHIQRKTKHAKAAKSQLKEVCSWLSEKDTSLAAAAQAHVPSSNGEGGKKRKTESNDSETPKRKKTNKSSGNGKSPSKSKDVTDREEKAMASLLAYVKDHGGQSKMVENFRCHVTRKASDGRFDINFYNKQGKRFRSMVEVGRHFKLVTAGARSAAGKKTAGIKKRKSSSREVEAEKKRLRKEMEKLRKQHTRATKQLDDFATDRVESRYPIDDSLLQEESKSDSTNVILPTNCAAARLPDIDGFDGIPTHCTPELLMVWDFLCTFSRAISVQPISLEDFVQCLTYSPPSSFTDGDALGTPPVFLGEAHLGLLKLLLSDKTSDEWWWSILETDVTENAVANSGIADESDLPLIRIDFAALLGETEDPLITTSWLQNLESVRRMKGTLPGPIRVAIKNAMAIASNKWVLAYLRKALKLGKTSGVDLMKRSVVWLLHHVEEARPDLGSRSVNKDELFKQRAKVVEAVSQQMAKLGNVVVAVQDEDVASDVEIEESDDESDDSDDEEADKSKKDTDSQFPEPDEQPSTYIPQKPLPSVVDLLLPPGKPAPQADVLNTASWPHLVGATAARIMHRYKRLRNEVDDSLRMIRELPKLTVNERRQREDIASQRVFSEFAKVQNGTVPCDHGVHHLCSGGAYLELKPVERLSLLRVLVDACYDTHRVYEVVDSNYKQRTSAVKALDTEQRRAKREAKEKMVSDEQAARQDLSQEAKRFFIEEKREEIRKANETSKALTDDELEELTEQDILDFDEDIKADFDALPTPESFKKAQVVERVARIQEAAAFETELLTVLPLDDVIEKERSELAALEGELQELGGEEALLDPELDRSVARVIEKLRRDVVKRKSSSESLPSLRDASIDALKEAIVDGTIKSLRAAIRGAKTAKLFGVDEETNGVWAVDVVRDAHMELENAKQLKRVADAQKDLVSKLNKCFIRTEPLGSDRFRNSIWRFANSEVSDVWAEVIPILSDEGQSQQNAPGYVSLLSTETQEATGASDIEVDFGPKEASQTSEAFVGFSRREYHSSGLSAKLIQRKWGCHVSEAALRALMKNLESHGIRENNLRKNLKEVLENNNASIEKENQDTTGDNVNEEQNAEGGVKASGDEEQIASAKQNLQGPSADFVDLSSLQSMNTAIGQSVRVRTVLEKKGDNSVARYDAGLVTGWRMHTESVDSQNEDEDAEPTFRTIAQWRAVTSKRKELWLNSNDLLESIARFAKWKSNDSRYFESDARFLMYRNSLGRHCGRVAEAAHSMTPLRFAQSMVKREAELYQKLKHRGTDDTWGGRNGTRNAWVASMKDYAFDLRTVRDGLITLESAFFEITGSFGDAVDNQEVSGRELLNNPATREDIELESLEKGLKTLWNAKTSRAVFLEIMSTSKTVGLLSLGFDLLCRNTRIYIQAHSTKGASAEVPSYYEGSYSRQQSWQDESFYDGSSGRVGRRAARVNYTGLD